MPDRRSLKVLLARPRGFCAGVERAIAAVERALELYGPPVYVRHEIVHNNRVVDRLKARGARFVDEVDEIPEGAPTVFSAHGVSRKVEADAAARRLAVVDATCPLVGKVHKEGRRYAEQGFAVVLIGHAGHPEIEGTRGQIPAPVHLVSSAADVARLDVADPSRVAYVTQTTLSVDDTRGLIGALKARFPAIRGPDVNDICYATQNRQTAVRALAGKVGLILVAGAANSSNSNRLREIGAALGVPSRLVGDPSAVRRAWLDGVGAVGITAGASAPEDLVQDIIARLARWRDVSVETLDGVVETVRFRLPDVPPAAAPG